MSTIQARYITGDEVTLAYSPTINAVKVRIATIHNTFAPNVTLFTIDSADLLSDDSAEPPDHVRVVLHDRDPADAELWRAVVLAHAKSQDSEGLKRANAELERHGHGPGNIFCSKVLVDYVATHAPETQCVMSLLGAKGDVNYIDKAIWLHPTPLLRAIQYGHCNVVDALISARADIHYKDMMHETGLMIAAKYGYVDITNALVEAGADVNYEEEQFCQTPLLLASVGGNADVVEVLLKAKASIDYADAFYNTALSWAEYHQHEDVSAVLRAAGGREASAEKPDALCNLMRRKELQFYL